MGSYDRFNAWLYAVKYANVPNPAYRDFSTITGHDIGGDCTNFISQCMFAGGWSMIPGYYWQHTVWFGQNSGSFLPVSYGYELNSNTWSSASWFVNFLTLSGRARQCKIDELEVGDLVIEYPTEKPRHIMLVTESRGGENISLSYHTHNRLNKPFSEIKIENNNNIPQHMEYAYYKIKDFFPD